MKYDLYDFDKTVYPYDSETVFLFHCLFRKPWLLILSPWLLLNLILFFLGFGDKFKGQVLHIPAVYRWRKRGKEILGEAGEENLSVLSPRKQRAPHGRLLRFARIPAQTHMREIRR